MTQHMKRGIAPWRRSRALSLHRLPRDCDGRFDAALDIVLRLIAQFGLGAADVERTFRGAEHDATVTIRPIVTDGNPGSGNSAVDRIRGVADGWRSAVAML